ncbi:MAG TPA: hypothetical protein VGQ25_06710 [Gemmatimonadales bacterium]|jgi:hypothetical protein|nr:hypothetical protein [Gemmatimonadales bacterium]
MRRPLVVPVALALTLVTCQRPANAPPPRSTLVIGLDVSGSYRQSPYFDEAIQFASLYIWGHLNAAGELKPVTDLFVGTLGGERVGEPKSFHPIQDFTGKSPDQIAADLRGWFPETDPLTDFNAFFQRVSVHIKRQNLVLSPLNIVMFSDGMPDMPGARRMSPAELYSKVDMSPLEYLSRSVSVRLLYATPSVAQNWERLVKRQRVRIWTQDEQVMQGWKRHLKAGAPPERQDSVWSWMEQIVDFRVRRGRIL